MSDHDLGNTLHGDPEALKPAYQAFRDQEVDYEDMAEGPRVDRVTTLGASCSVSGPGTFSGAQQTLTFLPSERPGWWIDRNDQPDSLPMRVAIDNVWTTGNIVSNIVLRAGSPHNYLRMVEHIIALRVGLGLDNVVVRTESGDPPLFERGSLDLVEAIEGAGIVASEAQARYVTVKETASIIGPQGSFLVFHPAPEGSRQLTLDCAVDFPNAIGKQRIRFDVNRESCKHGSFARTNTSVGVMLYCMTVGKVFADIRNLGYSRRNLLIAGKREYSNEPRLMHSGRSLEAAWHRASLDLLAAVALIADGRFAGHIESYKAGHALDCQMVTRLYQNDLLEPVD
jgi:UDP-3-O-acyl-N-acetylglucosamine deacetylase